MNIRKKINNGIFYVAISLVAVIAVGYGVYAYSLSQNVNVEGDYNYYEAEGQEAPEEINLGGAGQNHYFMNNFFDGAMVGGATSTIATTTSVGDLLLTTKQLCDNNWVILGSFTTDAGFTMTLPTAALLNSDCYRGQGMSKAGSFYIENNSGQNATVTAGTGGELLEGDSLNVVIADGRWVKLEVIMNTAGDRYILSSTELQDGD